MHHQRVRLFFNEPAGCIAFELRTERIKLGADGGRERLKLAAAIGMNPFGAMETPDFGARLDLQERRDLFGRAASDDDHARSALVLDLIQQFADAPPRLRPETINAERRQRAVIIEQQ